MSQQYQDGFWTVLGKTLVYFLAWLGSWTLGEVQALMGIVSALVLTGYGLTQWWVLWRDKVRGKE